jgi:hypothetical protein
VSWLDKFDFSEADWFAAPTPKSKKSQCEPAFTIAMHFGERARQQHTEN